MRTTIEISPMLITFILLMLKLTNIIDISWLWVFCPIWIPFALLSGIFLVCVVIWLTIVLIDVIKELV